MCASAPETPATPSNLFLRLTHATIFCDNTHNFSSVNHSVNLDRPLGQVMLIVEAPRLIQTPITVDVVQILSIVNICMDDLLVGDALGCDAVSSQISVYCA